jgi:beta-lactam-binding protein with PASTA domain
MFFDLARRNAALVAILLLSITLLGCPKAKVLVPGVEGDPLTEADADITLAGLLTVVIEEKFSYSDPVVEEGYVITQSPAPNSSVPLLTEIELVVSKGSPLVPVPNVLGMTIEEAATAIYAAELTVGDVSEEYSETIPEGLVLLQLPAFTAEPSVEPDSPVDLTISKGPTPIIVPDVAGMTEQEATDALVEAGLILGEVTHENSDDVEEGLIIRHNPLAGTVQLQGTPVDIWVSDGPRPRVIPDLVGLEQSEAEITIATTVFTLGTVSEIFNDDIPAGHVISQSPEAGEEAFPQTVIDLIVSLGPEFVPVPDVRGLTLNNAAADLSGALLTLGEVTESYSDTVLEGLVISQDPQADAMVSPQTPVDLVVSLGLEPVGVPNIVGMSRSDAALAIESAMLSLGVVTEVYDGNAPVDEVVGQNPVADVLVLPGTAVNMSVSKGPEFEIAVAVAPFTATSPTVDGEGTIGEYTGPLYDTWQHNFGDLEPENAADFSARWTATHDVNNIYIIIEVHDDVRESTGEGWLSDNVEIFIDAQNSKVNFYGGLVGRVFWSGTEWVNEFDLGEVAVEDTGTVYTVEWRIPKNELDAPIAEDDVIGFDIKPVDMDGRPTRDTHRFWGSASTAVEHWDNCVSWGTLVLESGG